MQMYAKQIDLSNIILVRGDVGVLFAHGLAELQKLAVRGLDDVGFGNDGHAGFVVFFGEIIRQLRNALGTVGCSDGEIQMCIRDSPYVYGVAPEHGAG